MMLLESPPRSAQTAFSREGLLSRRVVGHTSATDVHSSFVDPGSGSAWNEAVAAHPQATLFHTAEWAQVLSATYGHRPFYLRYERSGGGTAALLPLMGVSSAITGRRGVCLPFSDHCEPLLFDEPIAPMSLLNDVAAVAKQRGWKFVEFRGSHFSGGEATPVYQRYYAHRLDLSRPIAALSENCSSAFRRGLRKAERSGLRVEVRNDAEAVRLFYALHMRTRRRHGVPPQPFSFFENIHACILKRSAGSLVIATRDGHSIAAAMFFHFQRNGIFKFGASDHRYQELRASNLVMWEGIKHCASLGVQSLHLGRTDVPQEGLRRFKLALGAEEETLGYYRYSVAENRWLSRSSSRPFSAHTALFRRLPLTVNRLAGTILYPHLH